MPATLERGLSAVDSKITWPLRPQERFPDRLSSRGTIVDLVRYEKEQAKQKEHFYSKEWVQQEVLKVKQTPVQPGETPWWHLSGTGFWVKEQIGQLVRNLHGVGREAFPNVLELELSKVEQDFIHFEREYLQQMATLTWNLSWQPRDGHQRVICPDYKGAGENKNGSLWSSVTSGKERDGIVFKTLFGSKEEEKTGSGGVEGWLKKAKPGSFAVIISPEGWSGYENYAYKESQVYAIQVLEGGKLKAHTFRYDATVAQNEALQRDMGLEVPRAQNQRERIKNTIANVALLSPEDAKKLNLYNFEDFVDLMQSSVGGREVAYGKGGGVKTFDEIRAFVRNPEAFIKAHQMTDKLNERFKEYARWRFSQGGTLEEIEVDLQIAKAFNALQLNKAYDLQQELSYFSPSSLRGRIVSYATPEQMLIAQSRTPGAFDYGQAKESLSKKPGCAGGGQEIVVTTMGGGRVVIRAGGGGGKPGGAEVEDQYGSLDFECTKGHKNTRPRGQKIPKCTTCGEKVDNC